RTVDGLRLHSPAAQHLFEDAAIRLIVIDDEHSSSDEKNTLARSREHTRLRSAQLHGEMESAALADFALDPHPAAHHLDEAVRDRETEAGAAVLTGRGSIRLRERIEDEIELVGRDPDSRIRERELNGVAVRSG